MDIAKLKGFDQSTVNHVVDSRDFESMSEQDLAKILEGSSVNARH